MANEKINGQDRMNQYDGEEYKDSSSSSMLMEDSIRCAVLDLEQVRGGASLENFGLSLSLGLCLVAQKTLNSNFTF